MKMSFNFEQKDLIQLAVICEAVTGEVVKSDDILSAPNDIAEEMNEAIEYMPGIAGMARAEDGGVKVDVQFDLKNMVNIAYKELGNIVKKFDEHELGNCTKITVE